MHEIAWVYILFKCVYIAPIVARYISSSTYAYQLLSVVSGAFHAYTVPVSTSTWNSIRVAFIFVMDRIPTQFRIDGSEHRMCSRRDGFIGNIQKHYVLMVLGGFIRHVRVHSLFLNDFPSYKIPFCSFFHEQIHEKSILRTDQIHGKLQLRRRPKPSAWPGSGASCGRRRSSAPAPQRWWLSARSSASEMSAGVS